MENIKFKLIIAIVFSTFLVSTASAKTVAQKVGGLDFFGTSQVTIVYAATAGGWGDPLCPTAFQVTLDSSSPSYKEQLAGLLTAQAAGYDIIFFGTCGVNPATYNATRIRLLTP